MNIEIVTMVLEIYYLRLALGYGSIVVPIVACGFVDDNGLTTISAIDASAIGAQFFAAVARSCHKVCRVPVFIQLGTKISLEMF